MYIYWFTGGSISGRVGESVPWQIPLLGLLVIAGAARGTRELHLNENFRSVPHFLQPPAIDKVPESNAKIYVNQGVKRWRSLESTYCVTSISPRNTGTWAFFSNAVFNHFPLEDFSQTNGNRLVGAQERISKKHSKSTNSPNFSFNDS